MYIFNNDSFHCSLLLSMVKMSKLLLVMAEIWRWRFERVGTGIVCPHWRRLGIKVVMWGQYPRGVVPVAPDQEHPILLKTKAQGPDLTF